MPEDKLIDKSILKRAQREIGMYDCRLTGITPHAGEQLIHWRVEHKSGDKERRYDTISRFDHETECLVPISCTCPYAVNHPREACKHIVFVLLLAGNLASALKKVMESED